MSSKLKKWVDRTHLRLEKERKDFMDKKGYKEFFRPDIGETTVTLLPHIPRNIKSGQYGVREAFRIAVDGVELDWAVNPRSPVYRALVEHLEVAPVEFKLIRTGEGKSTRYSLVW